MTVLMVANTGGHLQQLSLLAPRLPFDGPRLWVTTDTAQSRSLLEGEEVHFVPDITSRDYAALAKAVPDAIKLSGRGFEAAVSTGSALALAYLPPVALRRVPTHYIESATRTHGPSFSGRLLQAVPGMRLYTQHEVWASRRWAYPGSVFDGFEVVDSTSPAPATAADAGSQTLAKIVVSLGTTRRYGFRRLVETLVELVPPEAEVMWQTGCTDVSGLGIEGRDQVPATEMQAAIAEADLVVAHAGTGIALTALIAGRSPVLVPRSHAHGEHVDDHQSLTGDLLAATGLAVVRPVEALTTADLTEAAARRVVRSGRAHAPLELH